MGNVAAKLQGQVSHTKFTAHQITPPPPPCTHVGGLGYKPHLCALLQVRPFVHSCGPTSSDLLCCTPTLCALMECLFPCFSAILLVPPQANRGQVQEKCGNTGSQCLCKGVFARDAYH